MISTDIASMYRHERCQHRTPSGRRCSVIVTDARYAYCPNHVPTQPHDSEDLSAPLTENAGQFLNAQGINYSLAALYHLLASGKISARRAGTLAYISSLLLHSLNCIDHDRHPTAGFEEKPAKVYANEAQWALAMMTPPIVPPPTSTRIYSDPSVLEEPSPTSAPQAISPAQSPTFAAAPQQLSAAAEIATSQIATAAANSASAIPQAFHVAYLAQQTPPAVYSEVSEPIKIGAETQNQLSPPHPSIKPQPGKNSYSSTPAHHHVEPPSGLAGQVSAPFHHPAGHGVLSSARPSG